MRMRTTHGIQLSRVDSFARRTTEDRKAEDRGGMRCVVVHIPYQIPPPLAVHYWTQAYIYLVVYLSLSNRTNPAITFRMHLITVAT
jgi:hypothetical protein